MEQLAFDMTLSQEESRVWDVIKIRLGADKAILGTEISYWTSLDYDKVREIVSTLVRKHGYVIASSAHGYYVPVTLDEIRAATRSLRHRGIMILVRAAKLEKTSLLTLLQQSIMEFQEDIGVENVGE